LFGQNYLTVNYLIVWNYVIISDRSFESTLSIYLVQKSHALISIGDAAIGSKIGTLPARIKWRKSYWRWRLQKNQPDRARLLIPGRPLSQLAIHSVDLFSRYRSIKSGCSISCQDQDRGHSLWCGCTNRGKTTGWSDLNSLVSRWMPNTLAAFHLERTSLAAGTTAENASTQKIMKYADSMHCYDFIPNAVETMGSWSFDELSIECC